MRLLHIGMAKSASTYLQTVLFPKILGTTGSCLNEVPMIHSWLEQLTKEQHCNRIPLIMSHEALSGHYPCPCAKGYPFNQFKRTLEYTANLRQSITIFIAIRETESFAKSLYLQQFKNRFFSGSFDEYLDSFASEDLSIYRRLEYLKHHKTVAIYLKDIKREPQSIANYICEIIGRPPINEDFFQERDIKKIVHRTPTTKYGMFLQRNAIRIANRYVIAAKTINKYTDNLFFHSYLDTLERAVEEASWSDPLTRFGDKIRFLNNDIVVKCNSPYWQEFFKEDWEASISLMSEMRPSFLQR